MARKPAADGARARFAAMLSGHLRAGTRPATAAGEPWTYAEFASEVPSARGNEYVSERSVSNWCKGTALPEEIEPILRALFGPGDRHAAARDALREAFLAARAEKYTAVVTSAEPDAVGPTWIAAGDQFTMDRTTSPSDQTAAADPLRQQLQAAIRDIAAELADAARRVANTATWGKLPATAKTFHTLVDGDPLAMPLRLGDAYAAMVRLGGFLDTDIRVQRDRQAADDPLDPDIHGLLTHLVCLAAPWLSEFPTVAAWDAAAGRVLVRAELFQPAREFTRIARDKWAIPNRDAEEMELLAEAEDAAGFLGQKAGNRAAGGVLNLILAVAGTVGMFLSGAVASDFATRSLLVQRAGALLAAAETQVEKFAATLPAYLRHALLGIVKEGKLVADGSSAIIPSTPRQDVPDDVEEQAKAMILDGRAPPDAWRPFIRRLDFAGTSLHRLDLLSDLAALQNLNLRGTKVSDVSPLAALTALQSLNLRGARVRDVSPLSGLTALQSLDLTGAQVSDVSPLSGLTALQSLNLRGAQMRDVSPLSGLTALQSLDLTGAQVSDVSPLAGLTALQSLNLRGAQVSDVSPLSGLTALQSLYLAGTRVSDVSPLSGLAGLQRLDLARTQVSDVSPLSGLTALQYLHLTGTQVSDVSPLALISNLRIVGGPPRKPATRPKHPIVRGPNP
jgi:Leucine-rich repeat (LRR) protein